jgi:outer membrane receptor protein involved in Fe transport
MILFIVPTLHAHAQELPTVTVTGKKETVVRKLDKTVHDVSNLPRAENGTAQDVLQATPGISVTADGQISVAGNAQVTVLVNGKPAAALSGEERAVALQTMNGADIASVEVITNPSAAHQANGGAIVNIVLKRNRKPGAHAQVRGSVGDHGLWNTAVSGDMTRKNVSMHGNVALRHDGNLKIRRSEVEWHHPAGGGSGHTVQASEVFVRRTVENATLGVDYDFDEADSVSLSASHNARRSRPWLDTLNVVRGTAGETVYHRISHGPNEQADDNASMAYSHQRGGMALKAVAQQSRTVGLIDKSYSDVFIAPAAATACSHAATRSTRRLNQATVDWSLASGRHKWGAGLDMQDQVDDLANYRAAVDRATGVETSDAGTTNGYAVATKLAAAYLTHQTRHGRWEALLGGRIERTTSRVIPADGIVAGKKWRSFNPSIHVEYAASDRTAVTLAYRRSLQRPDPRDLNPFTTYIDAQNLGRGNPGLGPQRLTSWEIGADVDAGSLSGNLAAFHRTSRDTVVDARGMAGDVIVTSKRNGGLARSAGITASLDWKPDAKLALNADGGAWRVVLDTPDADGSVHQDGLAGYLNFTAAYSAGQDDVSLDAHVQSAHVTPFVRHGATSSVNVTWKHRLTAALSLTVNASDLFDGSGRTHRTNTAAFRQEGMEHFVARRIYIGFVMKTG